MTRFRLFCAIGLVTLVSSSMQPVTETVQVVTLERSLGSWHSTEQFDASRACSSRFGAKG